ncbi:hypothetical protein ACROYT_G037300 [Oculina patagonica]
MKSTVFVVLLLCFASLGHALICRSCFSTVSSEDCDENATEMTCQEPTPVCMMYQTTAVKDGEKTYRYIRYCTSQWLFKTQQEVCKMKPQEIPGLGLVMCRAHKDFCTKPSC